MLSVTRIGFDGEHCRTGIYNKGAVLSVTVGLVLMENIAELVRIAICEPPQTSVTGSAICHCRIGFDGEHCRTGIYNKGPSSKGGEGGVWVFSVEHFIFPFLKT